MHLKGKLLMTLLYLSLLWSFVTDFFHDSAWMSATVQYGPMGLAWLVIIVIAIFEGLNKKEKNETVAEEADSRGKRLKVSALVFLWGVVAAMNFLVGKPRMNLLQVNSPEFWVFLIMIPLFTVLNYKRKTDGVS
ncbi:hypothetical protein [Salinicoccus albus]|uniref:hypothetical protein n=1 Tax=Salinicoccus albus TaxID=418756 RepID=UPI00035D14A8|nr:hypothetical protein [Salinicoccus albus]